MHKIRTRVFRKVTPCLVKSWTSCLTVCYVSASLANQKPQAQTPPRVFGEWFAAGSGCRATHKAPGDVSLVEVSSAAGTNTIRGKFILNRYSLKSPPDNPKTSLAFAKECSLRVQIIPPQDKKVRSVSARTVEVASKNANVKLQIQNTLYMDTNLVGAWLTEFPAGESFANRDFEVSLNPGTWRGVEPRQVEAPRYECGKMMVFGSDFTVIAHRKKADDQALVRVGGNDNSLEFAVELEDCDN